MINEWENNKRMQSLLMDAGWRYAALIGITTIPDQSITEKDRSEFPNYIYKIDNLPAWDCLDAIDFVYAKTGYQKIICAKWLDYDWSENLGATDHETALLKKRGNK